MCLLIDNMCHRKRNDYKIDMAIDTFWHESIVHKIGKVLFYVLYTTKLKPNTVRSLTVKQFCVNELYSDKFSLPFEVDLLVVWVH